MNMEVINKIEASISELEARLKKNNEFVGSVTANVEKLLSDKATTVSDSNVTSGAIQAFNVVLKELKSGVKDELMAEAKNEA